MPSRLSRRIDTHSNSATNADPSPMMDIAAAAAERPRESGEALIRAYYAKFNARRIAETTAMISPHCEFDHVATRDKTHGRRGYGALVQQWLEASSDMSVVPEHIVCVADGAYHVTLRIRGHRDGELPIGREVRLPADGSAFDVVGVHELRVQDGLIVSSRFVYDPADLTRDR